MNKRVNSSCWLLDRARLAVSLAFMLSYKLTRFKGAQVASSFSRMGSLLLSLISLPHKVFVSLCFSLVPDIAPHSQHMILILTPPLSSHLYNALMSFSVFSPLKCV